MVCRPHQWIKLVRYFRSKGENFPPNFEDEFLNHCLKVLTEEETHIERKEYLTPAEEEAVKIMAEKALDIEIDPSELEQDTWKKDATNES